MAKSRAERLAYLRAYHAKHRKPRTCRDCGVGIDARPNASRRCEPCQAESTVKQNRTKFTKWVSKNPAHYATLRLQSRRRVAYGLSPAEVDGMLDAQGHKCAACGQPPSGTVAETQILHVDHDHATGAVRGMLCVNCNRALGYLKDDPERILALWRYLVAHRARSVA